MEDSNPIPTTSNIVFKSVIDFFNDPTAVQLIDRGINSNKHSAVPSKQFKIDVEKLKPAKKGISTDDLYQINCDTGMCFESTYYLGSVQKYKFAFTSKIDASAPMEMMMSTTTGDILMCLGIIMKPDADGEVHVMCCQCVRTAIRNKDIHFDPTMVSIRMIIKLFEKF